MKKQFKAESKKLFDMKIHSIYTNQEIYLRELISNASDALDKLYYKSLTDTKIKVNKEDLEIRLIPNKENRTLTIKDNGIGMTKEELENNLGTIAKSGSELFKENMKDEKNLSIIGQFGVGFYSSFMVSDKVVVNSKSLDGEANTWESEGASGYTIDKSDKKDEGTEIILYLKEDTEENNFSDFLETYTLERLVKKYSDYIPYPVKMTVEETKKTDDDKEETVEVDKTLNSMTPIWKKPKSEVKDEDYQDFYTDKFYDYEKPLKVIRSEVEGRTSYQTLLFIPSHAPYNYYSKDYEKGLQLYSKGVLIMDKCSDLLPDYFSFVKGLVDSEDIALNISRETLQENYQIQAIAKSLESKIKKELETMLSKDRETYEKFYQDFGMQLKYGIYSTYGMKKDLLQDLLLFNSSNDKKYTTLKEYISRMKKDQKNIYYACSESLEKCEMLPQVDAVKEKGYEVLYLTEYLDEFTIKTLSVYDDKTFMNVADEKLDLSTEEEKKELEEANKSYKDMLDKMKSTLTDSVVDVTFTNHLKNHPVCLKTKGEVSTEMEKVLQTMPNNQNVKAETVMEINMNHPITKKMEDLYNNKEFDTLDKYSKVLYQEARLIEGLSVENPTELSNLICDLLAK